MEEIEIRLAEPEDAGELLAIYAPYVEETAITFEYTVPSLAEFQERIRHTRERYPYLVAASAGKIVGYAYAGPFKGRRAYDWAVETSIYVDGSKKRMGIGKALHQALEQALREQGILNMNACIACPEEEDPYLNRDSILFHQRMGFQTVGRFPSCGYKFHRWYHMVWMLKNIGEHREEQPEVKPFSSIRQGEWPDG